MKFNASIKRITFFLLSLFVVVTIQAQEIKTGSASEELFNKITTLDSIFFTAYNQCDLTTQASFYSDSIEFYHDKGGLSTSKKEILDATRKNICGKVTRELVKGSIEVYPIKDYGAVEMGLHKFHNHTEKESNEANSGSRFIIIWHHKNGQWEIARVISLH
jgi:ketosteroid isomerase-like protein